MIYRRFETLRSPVTLRQHYRIVVRIVTADQIHFLETGKRKVSIEWKTAHRQQFLQPVVGVGMNNSTSLLYIKLSTEPVMTYNSISNTILTKAKHF